MQVGIFVGKPLPLGLCPHHEGVHRPADAVDRMMVMRRGRRLREMLLVMEADWKLLVLALLGLLLLLLGHLLHIVLLHAAGCLRYLRAADMLGSPCTKENTYILTGSTCGLLRFGSRSATRVDVRWRC